MRNLPLTRATVLAVCLSLAASLSAETLKLTLLDGQQIEGEVNNITSTGKLEGPGIPAGLDLDGLRSIRRTSPIPEVPAPQVIVQLQGGEVRASGVTLADEKLNISWKLGQGLVVPIDQVRAIRFDTQTVGELFDEALAAPSAEHDRLFVKIDGRLQSLTGLIERITDDEVLFDFEGRKRTLARKQLYGIVVAQFNEADRRLPPFHVALLGGSRLEGESISLAAGQFALSLSGDATAKLPLSSVIRIDIRSSRLAFLSDLEPVEVEESPLVTQVSPWQRDRSVGKNTLTLTAPGGQSERKTVEFDKGLGVHSRSRLTFDVGGDYDTFAAVIGIDAETEGRGDCEFVVLGDNRELYRQRVRGGEEPRTLQLDVDGVERITLLVEPGEDLDLADHADWCDARLLKNDSR